MSKPRLAEQIANLQKSMLPNIPAETLELLMSATRSLAESGLADRALGVGDACPDFSLPDATGNKVNLYDRLATGPVVISFYRGAWCPYCNLEIRALAERIPAIRELGAELIAISPQVASKAEEQASNLKLDVPVLSDKGNHVARRFGLVFALPENIRPIYDAFEFDLPGHNGDENYELPIPATYIVDKRGIIQHAFVDPDYTQRLEPDAIVEELKKL